MKNNTLKLLGNIVGILYNLILNVNKFTIFNTLITPPKIAVGLLKNHL